MTSRLPAARRPRSSESRTSRAQGGRNVGGVARVDEQGVLALDRHIPGRTRAPAAQQRQAGRGSLAHRRAEGLVRAHERQHVGLGVERRQLVGRHIADHPHDRAGALGRSAQPVLQRPGAGNQELGLAVGEARGGKRADQRLDVLVRHEPADAQHSHRSRRPVAVRPLQDRLEIRALQRDLDQARIDAEAPQALAPLGARDHEAVDSRRQGAVHAQLQRRQLGIAPGRELAEDHEREAAPATPRKRAPGRRPELPAHHAFGTRPRERAGEAAGQHERRAAGAGQLPRPERLVRVGAAGGEPVRAHVPARLGTGQVDHARGYPPALGEPDEERLPVGHGNRREDCARRRHTATLPYRPGSKRLAMHVPRGQITAEGPCSRVTGAPASLLDAVWEVRVLSAPTAFPSQFYSPPRRESAE